MRIAVHYSFGLTTRIAALFVALNLGWAGFAAAQSVTPDGGSEWALAGSGGVVTFTVANPGTYDISCSYGGLVLACTPSATWVQVGPSGPVQITVSYTTGNGAGNGNVTLLAVDQDEQLCDPSPKGWCPPPEQDSGYYTVVVSLAAPAVSLAQNPVFQDYARCANACFAATYAHSTPAYVSMDTPRSATISYNSDHVNPRPFILVNASDNPYSSYTPNEYRLSATLNGASVTFLNTETTLKFTNPGTPAYRRLGGQFDASGYATGIYDLTVLVTSVYGAGTVATAVSTKLIIVNETNALVGRGWSVAGIQRAYVQGDGSLLITDGAGGASYFAKSGSTFTAPAGDLSRVVLGTPGALPGSYTRMYADSTKVIFNSSGEMTLVLDRLWQGTSVSYSAPYRPGTITDQAGKAITFNWGTYGLQGILSGGRTTDISVDATRRVNAIWDPDGRATSFGYSSNHLLTSITDRGGHQTVIGWQSLNGVATHKTASITAPAVSIDGGAPASPVTGLVAWQSNGVPYGPTTAGYSPLRADTVRATITEPGGAQHRYTTNWFGQPGYAIHPLNQWEWYWYNASGLPTSYTNSAGASQSWGYNANGFMTSATADGLTTQFQDGGWGQADSIVGPNNSWVERRGFSGTNGNLLWRRLNSDTSQTTYYNYILYGSEAERVWSIRDAGFHILRTTTYDPVHRNTATVTEPGGRTTTTTYDNWGRATAVTAPGQPTRTITYDVMNRPLTLADGVNPQPTRSFFGPLTLDSVMDPMNQVYRFAYNALGWQVAQTDPAGVADSTYYTLDGDVARWRNRRGEFVNYAYDVLHRLRRRSGSNMPTDTFALSDDGRVTVASNVNVVESVFLNVRGQPDSTTSTYPTLSNRRLKRSYAYDTSHRLTNTQVTGSAGAPNNFWPRQRAYAPGTGYLTGIGFNNQWTNFTRTNEGLVEVVQFPGSGNFTAVAYNSLHDPMQIWGSWNFNATTSRQIAVDEVGRVREEMLPGLWRGRIFTYDGLGRMVAATFVTQTYECSTWNPDYGQDCWDELSTDSVRGFAYDPVGNRLPGTYLTGNRIQSFGGCTYTTDADGNVTARTNCPGGLPNVTFAWHSDNRLKFFDVSGVGSDVRYDAFGRLVHQWGGGTPANWFVWDGDRLDAILDGSGSAIQTEYSYYPGLDNLHAVRTPTGTQLYAHSDALGNVIALTNTSKQTRRVYTYDEWGQYVAGSDVEGLNNLDRARFKGALWLGHPSVELYYMRNRWYEPRSGRFLSEDPIGLAGGINPYTFASGDPVNRRDPWGLDDDCEPGFEPDPKDSTKCIRKFELDPVTVTGHYNPLAGYWPYDGGTGFGPRLGGGYTITFQKRNPCNSYSQNGWQAAALRGLCEQVHENGQTSKATACTAGCLADRWEGYGDKPLWISYLINDHPVCYVQCEYNILGGPVVTGWLRFGWDFLTGAGVRTTPMSGTMRCVAAIMPLSACGGL